MYVLNNEIHDICKILKYEHMHCKDDENVKRGVGFCKYSVHLHHRAAIWDTLWAHRVVSSNWQDTVI